MRYNVIILLNLIASGPVAFIEALVSNDGIRNCSKVNYESIIKKNLPINETFDECDIDGEWVVNIQYSDHLDKLIDITKPSEVTKRLLRKFPTLLTYNFNSCSKLQVIDNDSPTSISKFSMSQTMPYNMLKKGHFTLDCTPRTFNETEFGIFNIASLIYNGWLIQIRASDKLGTTLDYRTVIKKDQFNENSEICKLANCDFIKELLLENDKVLFVNINHFNDNSTVYVNRYFVEKKNQLNLRE